MKQRGAKIIVDCLIEQGVDVTFGYPGGQIIDVFDALYEARDKIRQVLTCHEQGATHAADGYARATGKVGVVIATSGPGATNLVTGIATAYMDSVPMVAITGNVPLTNLGRDSFQEVDIAGVTMPVTKHNYIVKDVGELAATIREAFKIAQSGRPGPVLVDVPKDIQQAMCDYEPLVPAPPRHKRVEQDTAKAVEMIASAQRPLLYVGGGCILSGASEELKAFAELLDAPVASSMMGLGAMPASHPLFAGMIGMHGHAAVAKAMRECDTLIAVGARFSDRVAADRKKFCTHANIVHIDIDNAEIDKNIPTSAHIMGDVKLVLAELMPKLKKQSHPEWTAKIRRYVEENPYKYSGGALNPRRVIEAVGRLTPDDQIIVTDVGQHQMWTAQSYPFVRPRTFLTSGGLGTMGYGMGAAVGAAMGTGKRVCLMTGDGSFHMNFNELVTAVKNKLPITVFLFNNNTLGMVRQWQTLFYHKHYSSTTLDMPTDYVKLAEALGGTGMTLTRDEDIERTVKEALQSAGPVVVDCRIMTDEIVLPMIPPGKTTDELITELPAPAPTK